MRAALLPLTVLLLSACEADAAAPVAPAPAAAAAPADTSPALPPLLAAYPPPAGAARIPPPDAFAAWAQQLPLRPEGTPVRAYDGRVLRGHFGRVIDMPMVEGDLQQCADALLRVRGEWLRASGQEAAISFYATSGDAIPWRRYAAGEVPYAEGRTIRWRSGGDRSWEGYLSRVFEWAGTISLRAYETTAVTRPPQPGDVLVRSGSPGHAVLLVDVARRGEETFILFVESYMPAQDLHVEEGPEGGWWRWDPEAEMDLRTWVFSAADLRAWR